MAESPKIRDAILLVAGVGARLRPLTETRPKCLIEINEVPLLIRLLRQLYEQGIEHVALATGYLEPKIRACVAGHSNLPEVTICANPDYANTNNAASLLSALPEVAGRPFILCDGDILVRRSGWLKDLLADDRGNILAMISPDNMGAEEMKIALGPDTRISRLSKELDPQASAGESVGVQVIAADFYDSLRDRLEAMSDTERANAYYEDIFADLMGEAHPFFAHQIPTDSWTEIDTLEDLEVARRLYSTWHDSAAPPATSPLGHSAPTND